MKFTVRQQNRIIVERLFLAVPRGCLQFVIVVFPDHTHLLFYIQQLHSRNPAISISSNGFGNKTIISFLFVVYSQTITPLYHGRPDAKGLVQY